MTYANAICAKGATLGAKVRPKEHIDARFVRRRAYGGARFIAFSFAVTPFARVKAELQILSLLQEHRA